MQQPCNKCCPNDVLFVFKLFNKGVDTTLWSFWRLWILVMLNYIALDIEVFGTFYYTVDSEVSGETRGEKWVWHALCSNACAVTIRLQGWSHSWHIDLSQEERHRVFILTITVCRSFLTVSVICDGEDYLKCHSRLSTGAVNNINDGWI